MPDGIHKTATSPESTAFSAPVFTYHPTNVRDVIQRQISQTVERDLDRVVDMSVGNFDGRFISNFPATVDQNLTNPHGFFYHMIGVSKGGDLSVAAP